MSVLMGFLAGALVLSAGGNEPCGDLLAIHAERPVALEFLHCETGDGQIRATATYRVSGQDARAVFDQFSERYGLEEPSFRCCGLQSRPVIFAPEIPLASGAYRGHTLTFVSDEFLVPDTPWDEIAWFYAIAEIVEY